MGSWAQNPLYVTPDGAGTRNGSTWTNALSGTALQGTLATAPSGTTVLVASGLYKPTTTADRTISFSIPSGVEVYGGYTAGTNTRTTNPSSTTLSGDIDTDNTLANNTYKVVQTAGSNVVLDGLVITQGDARPLGEFITAGGGGLFANGASLTLRQVQFITNAAKDGGGAFINTGSATLINCSFSSNTAKDDGAGFYLAAGTTDIITNCVFSGNTASNRGGGAFNQGISNPSPSFVNCSFSNNTAAFGGGALYNLYYGSPTLVNCSFSGNTATRTGGGAIYNGGFDGSNLSLTLTNCILWGNSATAVYNSGGASTSYNYTDSQDGVQTGTGNRSVNPLFVDAPNGDLRLYGCSPVINVGDNSVNAGSTDLAGNPRRYNGGIIDLGAYEFQGSPTTGSPIAITQQPVSSSSVCVGATVTTTVSVKGTSPAYQWYKDGSSLEAAQQSATLSLTSVTTDQSGSYSVVVTGSCNSVTSTGFSLTVNSAPTASLAASGTLTCTNTSVTLTASPTGQASYLFSTGATQIGSTNQATVSQAGTYSVTVTNASGCSTVAQVTVTGNTTAPSLAINSPTNPSSCSGSNGSISFTTNLADGSYSLTYSGAGSPRTVTVSNGTFILTDLSAGSYSNFSISNNGCMATAAGPVTLTAPTGPVATLSNNGPLTCAMTSVTLTASPEGATYAFSTGANQIGGSIGNTATVSSPGMYTVVVTSANGCTATATTTVNSNTELAAPVLQTSATSTVNQPISVTANGCSGGSINWNPQGGTGTPTGNVYTFSAPGNYTLTATCSVGSCTSPASSPVVLQIIGSFAITSVTTVDCSPVSANRFNVSFSPNYSGLTGQPISFEVTNELPPTMAPGPYTLSLYTDNSTINLRATQTGSPAPATYSYNWLAACQTTQQPNTPPSVVNPIPSQTAVVGQSFAYVIPANTFTDAQTPLNLVLSAQGLPTDLSFSGATISGTPSSTVGSPFSVTITATDPGGLSASTLLSLVVLPASSPVQPTDPFSITSVTTLDCTPVADRINLTFTPQYAGLNGQSISFEVINETPPTTTPAPYSLFLYRDNPTIQLRATQSGSPSPATFRYNWLAACMNLGQDNTPPRLNSPVGSQTAVVGQAYSLNLANAFVDQETPNQITLSASGLPAGLNLVGTAITGTPSASGVSTVTITATDPGSQTATTSFMLTVYPASSVFGISGVQTLSCATVSGGLRSVTFQPLYSGTNGQPISFSVVNEKLPTTDPGPYQLNLYTDNPVITLKATQAGTLGEATYVYSWLASCPSGARAAATEPGIGLQVKVLGNPIEGQTLEMEIRGVEGQRVILELVDLKGRPLQTHRIDQSATVEQVKLDAGSLPSQFILQISTARERQVIKLLKP